MKEEKLTTTPNYDSKEKEKNDYYSLPLATFTFGHNDQRLMQMSIKDKEESTIKKNIYNEEQQVASILKYGNEYKENNDNVINEKQNMSLNPPNNPVRNTKNTFTVFVNKFGSHNSFLSVIIHAIYNMKTFRDFITNELADLKEKDPRTKLLFALRSVLLKYSENKKIDLTHLRTSLAELFQNRRKFLIDHPDDPPDCYFAFVNAIHSHFMQYPLNEITDESCRDKCFAHKSLWLDLARIDECECKGNSKRLFSNHNYVFDIPLDHIFELAKTLSISPSESNNKKIRVKERHLSQIPYSMGEVQGKLLLYYRYLLNQIKSDCPVNGPRCNINKNHKLLILSNNPSYYVFSLQRSAHFQFSISDILRTFILIAKAFEIGALFEQIPNRNNGTTTNVFEFMGCVLMRSSKVYSCVFKNQIGRNTSWIYYDDETIINLSSWFELISFCMKSGDMPIMLFYNASEFQLSSYCEISQEDAVALERYSINADNLNKYYINRIRILEDVINTQDVNSSNTKASYISSTNDSNEHGSIKGGDMNALIKGGNTNVPQNMSHSKSRTPGANIVNGTLVDYYCQNCHSKNKIENKICVNCGSQNKTDLSSEVNYFLQKQAPVNSYKTNNSINRITKSKDKSPNISKENYPNSNKFIMSRFSPQENDNSNSNNKLTNNERSIPSMVNPFKEEGNRRPVTTEQEKDIRSRKHYDMPRPYIPKKEGPIMIRNNNISPSPPQKQKPTEEETVQRSTIKTEEKSENSSEYRRTSSKKAPAKNNNVMYQPEVWSCSTCNSLNKDYEYKCKLCKNKKTENSYTRIHTPKVQHSSGQTLTKSSNTSSSKNLEKKKSQGYLEQKSYEKKYQNYNTISHHTDIEKSAASLRSPKKKSPNGINYPSKIERPRTSYLEYPQKKKPY